MLGTDHVTSRSQLTLHQQFHQACCYKKHGCFKGLQTQQYTWYIHDLTLSFVGVNPDQMETLVMEVALSPEQPQHHPRDAVSNPNSGDASVADPPNASDLPQNDGDDDEILRRRTLVLGEVSSSQEVEPADEPMPEAVLETSLPNPGSAELEKAEAVADPYDVASGQHDGEKATNSPADQQVPEITHEENGSAFNALDHKETFQSSEYCITRGFGYAYFFYLYIYYNMFKFWVLNFIGYL